MNDITSALTTRAGELVEQSLGGVRVAGVDEVIAEPDAGIDDDRSVGVMYDEHVNGQRAERVVLGVERRDRGHLASWSRSIRGSVASRLATRHPRAAGEGAHGPSMP